MTEQVLEWMAAHPQCPPACVPLMVLWRGIETEIAAIGKYWEEVE
jgi:hypothetical protein